MKIECMVLGMFQTNTYIVIDEKTKKAVVIDPAADGARILEKCEKEGVSIDQILLPHGHLDYIGAVNEIKAKSKAEVICHTKGQLYLEDPGYNLSQAFGGPAIVCEADTYVEEGDTVALEGTDIAFEVIHAPGHTLDGIAFYNEKEKVIFVGDILFNGSIGRTDFPGGNAQDLVTNIQTKLFALPDDVVVYSGHGGMTTIGNEKRSNPYLR